MIMVETILLMVVVVETLVVEVLVEVDLPMCSIKSVVSLNVEHHFVITY